MKISKLVAAASAAFFIVCGSAVAQQSGTVTSHAFAIGKGPGVTGFASLLCGSAQLAVGQSAADPICRTLTGDVTISAAGVTAIGASKVTSSMLNADVLSTAHTWSGQQTFVAPALGTPASAILTNATGLPTTGLGNNVVTNAKLAAAGAVTLKGNPTNATANDQDFTLSGLTARGSPNAASDLLLIWDSAAGTFKSVTPAQIASAATSGVSSLNGLTGALLASMPVSGGRLTPSSGVCVPTTDVAAATSIFFAPCNSPYVLIYNGTAVQPFNFTSGVTDTVGLTLALGSNWAANTLYDVFVTINGGVPTLATVAWTSSGAGSSARATALALYAGMQTNATSATARISNAATITMAANQGTYLGTFLTNGSAGQVDLKFGSTAAGGGLANAGIWNMYNRAPGAFAVIDSNVTWTASAANTVQPLDGSATNRINFVTGLGDDSIDAFLSILIATSAGVGGNTLFGLNSTSSAITRCPQFQVSAAGALQQGGGLTCKVYGAPGLNFLQALQSSTSTTGATFVGNAQDEILSASWWW